MGMVRLTITHILKFWSTSHTFGISEARQFKFRVPTDTEEYYCKCDRVPGLGTIKKIFRTRKFTKIRTFSGHVLPTHPKADYAYEVA